LNYFNRKISLYEVVFEAVTDQFIEDMFGPYANQVSREAFQLGLSLHGWKFFEVKNLNELFAIKFEEFVDKGTIAHIDQLGDSAFYS